MKRPRRTLTTFAVGMLLLDAVLLGLAGVWYRSWLFIPAGLCALGALATIVLWRRYVRRMAELQVMVARRQEMRKEVESIRDLLQSHHFQN
jgi:hypothetical protein